MSPTTRSGRKRKPDERASRESSPSDDPARPSRSNKKAKPGGDRDGECPFQESEAQPALSVDYDTLSRLPGGGRALSDDKALDISPEKIHDDSDDTDEDEQEGSINDDEVEDNGFPGGDQGSDEHDHCISDEDDYDCDFITYDQDYDSEDEDARDYEIEEHELVIHGNPEQIVKLRVAVCKELADEFGNWLENIHVRCSHNDKTFGYAFGRYIRREPIRRHFWRDMEEPSQDMANIAFDLFDKYGCLKLKYKDHCIQKGTGVWGEELDYGLLLFIERVEITDKNWRRKGLGKAMVNLLVDKAEKRSKPEPMSPTTAIVTGWYSSPGDLEKQSKVHTIVGPGWLEGDIEEDSKGKSSEEQRAIKRRAIDSAVAFYRSMSFRRIAASTYFCFSSDPNHKSHALARKDDFDPPLESPEAEISDDDDDDYFWFEPQEREKKALERLKQMLPLHHAATTLPDSECLEYFKAFSSQNEASWGQLDRLKNNILHIAACRQKPLSTKWLIENANAANCLSLARNLEGYTPLEALQDQLETSRTKKEHGRLTLDRSDWFTGFPENAVACLALLGYSDVEGLSDVQRQHLTFGCTCGECMEGFVSPRMKSALLFQAESSFDDLRSNIGNGPTWCMWHDDMLVHVESGLRRNFNTNKSYRQGFRNIFGFVANSLRSNAVPRPENILREFLKRPNEWPPVTRNYLERGGTIEGKIEPVLRILFDDAQDQDKKAGNGELERTMGNEVSELPSCRNDHEFGFVAAACGVPRGDYF